ncbi:hypothetical protein PGTUg99_023848 [Puccinia graminis f. sp. tritici]|uniref:Uncharacterized protein n=1 Tax=Puccinia graminis f. sp. tritici TaxID=56615 RepID=A0A5B0LVX0_PUCGR|nr:hypothetical protein PGTUg99_023848 [Puccinia graminis f. sp. tritici]
MVNRPPGLNLVLYSALYHPNFRISNFGKGDHYIRNPLPAPHRNSCVSQSDSENSDILANHKCSGDCIQALAHQDELNTSPHSLLWAALACEWPRHCRIAPTAGRDRDPAGLPSGLSLEACVRLASRTVDMTQ